MARIGPGFPFNLLEVRSGSGTAGRVEFAVRLVIFLLAFLIWVPWKVFRGGVDAQRRHRRRRRRRTSRPSKPANEATPEPEESDPI